MTRRTFARYAAIPLRIANLKPRDRALDSGNEYSPADILYGTVVKGAFLPRPSFGRSFDLVPSRTRTRPVPSSLDIKPATALESRPSLNGMTALFSLRASIP